MYINGIRNRALLFLVLGLGNETSLESTTSVFRTIQNYTELCLPLLLTAPMLLAFAAYWKRAK